MLLQPVRSHFLQQLWLRWQKDQVFATVASTWFGAAAAASYTEHTPCI